MKKIVTAFAALTASVFLGPAQAGLVSYWSFDVDASDATGAHDGTLVGGAAISPGTQGFGGGEALLLTGAGQHVSTANPTTFDFNSDFTWHAYVKTDNEFGAIFGRAPVATEYNKGSKVLFLDGDEVAVDVGWVGVRGTGAFIVDGEWHQVIVTYVASTDLLSVYVDPLPSPGTVADHAETDLNVNQFDEHAFSHLGGIADTSFRIGQGAVTGEDFVDSLTGLIDEAAVFDTALTGAELDQLINDGPASFLAGSATAPVITSISRVGNTVAVNFEGTDGESYDLNKASSLDGTFPDSPDSTPDSITLSGTTSGTLTDSNADETGTLDAVFYQVKQQ